MKTAVYNFGLIQGTTFYKKITLKTADTGEPLDLTGYSARGQIRSAADSPIKLADIECTIPVPTNGEIFLYISAKNTAAIPISGKDFKTRIRCVYDIELYKPILDEEENPIDEEVYRILQGYVYIYPEVTK